MNELNFSEICKWTGRVWAGTWRQQAIVAGGYAALGALIVALFALGSVTSDAVAAMAMIPIIFIGLSFIALPYIMAGVMAPAAGVIIRGGQPQLMMPWGRLPSIIVWSMALNVLISVLSQLCVVPGLFVAAAMWPWTCVMACEPEASSLARAQEISQGSRLRYLWWHMVIGCVAVGPALMFVIALAGVGSGVRDESVSAILGLLFLTAGPLAVFLGFSVVGAFIATLYHLIRLQRDEVDIDALLTTFD